MRKNKLAALLAAIMMGFNAYPSTPAYAGTEDVSAVQAEKPSGNPENTTENPGNTMENPGNSQELEGLERGSEDTETGRSAFLESLSIPPQALGVFLNGADEETISVLLDHPELSALILPSLSVIVSDNAVTIRFKKEEEKSETAREESPYEKGTVRTQGSNLNVRTGAGLDYDVFSKLPDGSEVRVLGEEGGWYRVEIPARYGYVWGEYLETMQVQPAASAMTDEGTTYEINGGQLLTLLSLFSGSGREETARVPQEGSLTPPGNMTLVDDYGDKSGEGRQFVTMTTKNGNYFYLVIDRNDKDEENVHFLNQVDERDLLSLMEENEAAIYEKQQEAARKAAEEVLKEAEERARREAEQALAEQTVPKSGNPNLGMLAALFGFAVLAGAGVFLFRNRKKDVAGKAGTDPDYDEDDLANEMEEDMYEDPSGETL